MSLSFDAVRIFTRDLDNAIQFYGGLLEFKEKSIDREQGYAAYDVGGVTLMLELVDPEDDEEEDDGYIGCFTGISFRTENIFEIHQRLTLAGVHFEDMPASQPWGGLIAHLYDTDGNIITLVQYGD